MSDVLLTSLTVISVRNKNVINQNTGTLEMELEPYCDYQIVVEFI